MLSVRPCSRDCCQGLLIGWPGLLAVVFHCLMPASQEGILAVDTVACTTFRSCRWASTFDGSAYSDDRASRLS